MDQISILFNASGDLIIKVNNVCGNTALMVQECLKERLVKMTLIRTSAFSFHASKNGQ